MSWPILALLAIITIAIFPIRAFGRWLQRKGREFERNRRDDSG